MSARARITVTLEIDAGGGVWPDGCTLDEVYKAGKRAALQNLESALSTSRVSARIVGEPKVTAILVEDER